MIGTLPKLLQCLAMACALLACTPAPSPVPNDVPAVRSGEDRKLSTQTWTLIPRSGIEKNGTQIFFGMNRRALRSALSQEFGAPNSHRADEDDFTAPDKTLIRLRYVGDQMNTIEFLGGSLTLDNIALHRGARWGTLQKALGKRGYTFRETTWIGDGHDIDALGINIATREDVGGDEGDDEIEWVIMSRDWTKNLAKEYAAKDRGQVR